MEGGVEPFAPDLHAQYFAVAPDSCCLRLDEIVKRGRRALCGDFAENDDRGIEVDVPKDGRNDRRYRRIGREIATPIGM